MLHISGLWSLEKCCSDLICVFAFVQSQQFQSTVDDILDMIGAGGRSSPSAGSPRHSRCETFDKLPQPIRFPELFVY